jgi:imidazole glycerol-phosphate synthase subunit HisH
MKNLDEGEYMHFVHSYYAIPNDNDIILTYSDYEGVRYASSVIKDNLLGIQFHPEKSTKQGIEIYSSWANYIKFKSY